MMRVSKLMTALICVAAVSACTSGGEKGNPTTAPQTNGSSGNDSAGNMPARPADLKVDSVDPCKLLTTDQMKQINTSVTTSKPQDLVDGAQSPTCFYKGTESFTYTVGTVTHKGVSYWTEGAGNVDTKQIKVADYGAVEIQLKGGEGFDCSVAIDVADGQQLMVSYIPTSAKEKDQSVLCGKAEKAADLALATLKTLK